MASILSYFPCDVTHHKPQLKFGYGVILDRKVVQFAWNMETIEVPPFVKSYHIFYSSLLSCQKQEAPINSNSAKSDL
jgi:hypothetical protein